MDLPEVLSRVARQPDFGNVPVLRRVAVRIVAPSRIAVAVPMTAPTFATRAEWERAREACDRALLILSRGIERDIVMKRFDRLFPPPAEDAGKEKDFNSPSTNKRKGPETLIAPSLAAVERLGEHAFLVEVGLAEPGRCSVCNWPFSTSGGGCAAPDACGYRPSQGSPEWPRLHAKREQVTRALAARAALLAALTAGEEYEVEGEFGRAWVRVPLNPGDRVRVTKIEEGA